MNNIIEMIDLGKNRQPVTTRSLRRGGQFTPLHLAGAGDGPANFFAIGGSAGITRGLAQAAASGVMVARTVHGRLQARKKDE